VFQDITIHRMPSFAGTFFSSLVFLQGILTQLNKANLLMDQIGQTYNGNIVVGQENAAVRADFIKKTYMHVAVSVLLFIGVEALLLSIPAVVKVGLWMTQGMQWLLMLGGFMFVTTMAERWAHRSTNKGQQYGALLLYVFAQAFIFVPLIYIAMSFTGDSNIIGKAGLMTLFLFSGLTAVVFITGKDFSFLRSAIAIGGMVALGLIVVSILFGFNLGVIFSAAMVLLAGASILYQTSNIINRYHHEQYVAASLGLFASLMLLFWYILQIFMSRE